MKKIFTYSCCFFTFLFSISIFGQTYRQIRIDGEGTGSDEAKSIKQTGDGGYIVAGVGRLSSGSTITFTVVKLSSVFNIEWTFNYRTYTTSPNDNQARDVIQLSDGSYIIAGSVNAGAAGCAQYPDLCLVKLASDGTYQWSYQRDRGACLNGRAKSVVETTDGGFIMVGDDEDGASFQMCALKVNSSGTFQWVKYYGGGSTEYGQKIIRTSSVENYVLAGITNSSGQGNTDLWINKIDNTGAVLWGKTLGGANFDGQSSAGGLCGLIEDTDGGYVLASSTLSFGKGNSDVYVVKFNSDGNKLWTRTVGGTANDFGYSIARTPVDDGYIIAGTTFSYDVGNGDMYIVKLNSAGSLLWTKSYGGTGADAANSIIQNTSGDYIVAGFTESYGKTDRDMYIISLNSSGNGCANLSYGGSESTGGTLATYTATSSPAGGSNTANAGTQGSVGSTTTVCSGAAMPIELLSFTGNYHSSEKIILNWSTASEQNNDYFTIERSSDEKLFEEIGKVNGSGNSSNKRYYKFIDSESPTQQSELLYYRLKQTDYDGQFEYFGPIAVKFSADDGFIINTNGLSGQVFISFAENVEEKKCSVKIYDISGRICYSSSFLPTKSKKEMWIDCSNWSKGIYIVSTISENGISQQKKFVKQ